MTRVLYVSPMPYQANAAVDAICHGMQARLAGNDAELRVAYADFAEPDWREQAGRHVRAGADAGYDAIVIWVIDPATPADAVGYARASGVPVISMERPRFTVDASVVYPNFNHGVYMAEHLAALLPPAGRVAVVGGPDVVDDIELLLGIRHGLDAAGLITVNDPEDPRYKNTTDVASGGKEKTANLLADFDKLDGLVPFNDETLLGAVEALREAGRSARSPWSRGTARLPLSSWCGPESTPVPGTSTRSASARRWPTWYCAGWAAKTSTNSASPARSAG